jgi:aldose 1-epimerase
LSIRFEAQRLEKKSLDIVQLRDAERDLLVSIVPSHGNIAYELLHGNENWLWSPFDDPLAEMRHSPALFGVPLLSPWANRLSSDTYSVNGAEYVLNRRLNNLRVDHNYLAIHGLVLFAPWTVVELGTNSDGAFVTSALHFTRRPDWMAQFSFAHRLEMTHRLSGGRLWVYISVTNESDQPIPLSLGFHPYFRLPGESDRNTWTLRCAGRKHLKLSDHYIPTGEVEEFESQTPIVLRPALQLDDVYTDLQRDDSGDALFQLIGKKEKLTVGFGPKFPVGVIYAPSTKNCVCFEPMTAPTDALHLSQSGLCDPLQQVAPGETWTERFWIELQ